MNWVLLKNSLLTGGLATVLALAFGLVMALWVAGLPPRGRSFFLALAIAALAMPPFLATNCWLHFLGTTGVWRRWLPMDLLSLGGTVWILALLLWPISFLAIWSAWQRLESWQLESDMAITGSALLRGLLLPLARPALGQAGALTLVLALNNFAVPAILQVKVLPADMWVRFNTTFDTLGALQMSWPLVLGPLVLWVAIARRGLPWPHLGATISPALFRRQLGPAWFWGGGVLSTVVCLASVGLPLIQILAVKRTWTELPGALAAGQGAVVNSLWFAAASATAIVFISLSIVLGSGAGASRMKTLASRSRPSVLTSLLWLPFLIPGVLLGIGLIAVFNRPAFSFIYHSAGIVILAFTIRYLGPGWHTIAHAAQRLDRDLVDVARLEGATGWQRLRHVYWPQMEAEVIAAWYIIFLLCLWDVESMILVVPPGGETLSLRVFNLLHYGHNAQVNALCLILLALALAPLALWRIVRLLRAFRPAAAWLAAGSIVSVAILVSACSPHSGSTPETWRSQLFSQVKVIGSRGVGVGQLNKPRSVVVDLQDNLYVVDMTGRVQKFSPAGVFLLSWQMPQTDLGKPKGMTRDQDGNIIVLEPHYARVNHFSPSGKLVAQWGVHGTNAGQLSVPRAVAMTSHREIFLSEYQEAERVQKFAFGQPQDLQSLSNSTPAHWLAAYGHAGNAPGEFNRPEGLCVDAQDRVYVADSCNHRIQVFSSDGQFLRTYGKPGRGLGELSYPYDICVDAVGRQYIAEFGNSRIQVFDASDRPIEILGGPGGAPGQFSNPWGVALDSVGNLYVADSQNHRVQKFICRGPGTPPTLALEPAVDR